MNADITTADVEVNSTRLSFQHERWIRFNSAHPARRQRGRMWQHAPVMLAPHASGFSQAHSSTFHWPSYMRILKRCCAVSHARLDLP